MGELIRIDHLSYTYHSPEGETPVIDDVSFTVKEGESVAVIGPCGCGKSTLLSLTAGLLKPDSGFIYIDEKDIKSSGKDIGCMLQKDQLLDRHNSFQTVSLGQDTQEKLSDSSYVQINEGINTYGMITFINSYPPGQSECIKQRAALIRSLLLEPDILLLDEPFSALDSESRLETAEEIWSMLRNENKTVLFTTNDISEAICLSDRVIVLSSCPIRIKKIIDIRLCDKESSPSAARNSPEYDEYYRTIYKEIYK